MKIKPSPRDAALLVLGLLGLGLSGFLLVAGWGAAIEPPGCGAGSGCGAVLSSKWSRVGGVPVTLPAAAIYLGVMIAAAAGAWSKPTAPAAAARGAVAGSLGFAAAWFVYVQAAEVGALCPYCLAAHGVGLAVAVVMLWPVRPAEKEPRTGPPLLGGLGVALLATTALAGVQLATPEPVARIDVAIGNDYDRFDGETRVAAMLDGGLVLTHGEDPTLGPPDAERLMAVLFDYACPHCRRYREALERRMAADPGALTVVLLPMALNSACNPAMLPSEDEPRFEHACDLARLSGVIHAEHREAWPAFDRWLIGHGFDAPTAAEAIAFAHTLIDPAALAASLAGERASAVDRRTAELGALWGETLDRGRLPVTLAPGVRPIRGELDDARWASFMDEVAAAAAGGAVVP